MKASETAATQGPDGAYYTPAQVAGLLQISPKAVITRFAELAGVLVMPDVEPANSMGPASFSSSSNSAPPAAEPGDGWWSSPTMHVITTPACTDRVHKTDREFSKLKANEQSEYWKWRHEHPDKDNDHH